jgi:Spy/CpxP family protein refolding chaperone
MYLATQEEVKVMNKRMINRSAVAAVLTGSLVLAGALFAQSSDSGMGGCYHHWRGGDHAGRLGMPGGPGMMRAIHKLDLSETQQKQLQDLIAQNRKGIDESMSTLQQGRKALREAMGGESYDAARVQGLADAQGKALTGLIIKRAETWQQVRALLTPEQRTKLDALESKPPCRDERS